MILLYSLLTSFILIGGIGIGLMIAYAQRTTEGGDNEAN